MDLPNNQGPRKSVIPGGSTLDRKTLNKILNHANSPGNGSRNTEDVADPLKRLSAHPGHRNDHEGPKTKYQLEKNSQSSGQSCNPSVHQVLLDSSCVFRARTAIPHGLLFDLHEEVFLINEFLLEEYKKCNTMCGRVRVSDSEMGEMVEDAQNALNFIAKHIGRDCEATSPQEYSTNKIYADAKLGISHIFDKTGGAENMEDAAVEDTVV